MVAIVCNTSIPMWIEDLKAQPRLLVNYFLKPRGKNPITPASFPEVGHTVYGDLLMIDSVGSLANWMEAQIWDYQDVVEPLQGIPYIRLVTKSGRFFDSSITASHRVGDAMLLDLDNGNYRKILTERISVDLNGDPLEPYCLPTKREIANAVSRFDLNSLHHGFWISGGDFFGGKVKLQRMLIMGCQAQIKCPVYTGIARQSNLSSLRGGKGNVPKTHIEYEPVWICCSFEIDIRLMRTYGLADPMQDLLIAIALYKAQKLFTDGFEPRSNCRLDLLGIESEIPIDFQPPSLREIEDWLPKLVQAAYPNGGTVTELVLEPAKIEALMRIGRENDSEDETGTKDAEAASNRSSKKRAR